MTTDSRMIEVCEHGMPLGWACSRTPCCVKTAGTSPARRADPPRFRSSEFMNCGHEDAITSLRFSLAAAGLEVERLQTAVFSEWKNGNMSEDARVRILAPQEADQPVARDTPEAAPKTCVKCGGPVDGDGISIIRWGGASPKPVLTSHDTLEAVTLYGVTIPVDKDGSCPECNAPAGVDRVPRCTHWLDALLEHNHATRTHDTPEAVWTCSVSGPVSHADIPPSGDLPMRQAVRAAYLALTGQEETYLSSGWGRPPTHDTPEAEVAALNAGTHEPAVDDFGNQYLARVPEMRTVRRVGQIVVQEPVTHDTPEAERARVEQAYADSMMEGSPIDADGNRKPTATPAKRKVPR